MSVPGRRHFTQRCHSSLLEESNASSVSLPGGTLGSPCLLSSRLRLCISLFVALALPPFAVIKPSCESKYVLSPAGFPSESPTPGMFLGTPVTTRKSLGSQCFLTPDGHGGPRASSVGPAELFCTPESEAEIAPHPRSRLPGEKS